MNISAQYKIEAGAIHLVRTKEAPAFLYILIRRKAYRSAYFKANRIEMMIVLIFKSL